MSEYDRLLNLARTQAEAFKSTAKDFIPRMYSALRNEDVNISPADARDRIEKDCVGIWSRRTILDALPDEAKDKEKQKAGRLGQKERNSAAISAAPQMKKEITLGADGTRIVENTEIDDPATSPSINIPTDTTVTQIPKEHESEKPMHIPEKLSECQNCKELYAENIELKEALRKGTVILTANKLPLSQVLPPTNGITGNNHANNVGIVNIEFSLPFREVHAHMANIFRQFGEREEVWFSLSIDKQTAKVITAKAGRITTKDKLSHYSDPKDFVAGGNVAE